MNGESTALRLPEVVPLFPLPNTVFFPHTVLPLHIFEPRYRAMLRDADSSDRLIAVALARGSRFHPIGTVGRLAEIEPLADGRFNIRLEGILRVALTEVPSNRLYRLARIDPRPERDVEELRADNELAKLDLLATLGYLQSELSEPGRQTIVFDERLPLNVAVNVVCAGLPVEPAARQALLEEDDLLQRQRRAALRVHDLLETVLRHKARTGGAENKPLLH